MNASSFNHRFIFSTHFSESDPSIHLVEGRQKDLTVFNLTTGLTNATGRLIKLLQTDRRKDRYEQKKNLMLSSGDLTIQKCSEQR